MGRSENHSYLSGVNSRETEYVATKLERHIVIYIYNDDLCNVLELKDIFEQVDKGERFIPGENF
jgi:hypothetical protein